MSNHVFPQFSFQILGLEQCLNDLDNHYVFPIHLWCPWWVGGRGSLCCPFFSFLKKCQRHMSLSITDVQVTCQIQEMVLPQISPSFPVAYSLGERSKFSPSNHKRFHKNSHNHLKESVTQLVTFADVSQN